MATSPLPCKHRRTPLDARRRAGAGVAVSRRPTPHFGAWVVTAAAILAVVALGVAALRRRRRPTGADLAGADHGRDQGVGIPRRAAAALSALCGCRRVGQRAPPARRRCDGNPRRRRPTDFRPGGSGGAALVGRPRGQPDGRAAGAHPDRIADLRIDVAVQPVGRTTGPRACSTIRRSPRGTSGVPRPRAWSAPPSSPPTSTPSSTTCCRSRD